MEKLDGGGSIALNWKFMGWNWDFWNFGRSSQNVW